MKIGILTIYQVPNYGSVLQAYATQHILEKMGHKCTIINYRYPNEWHWCKGAPRPNRFKSFIRQLIPSKKEKALNEFRQNYLHLSHRYNNLKELNNENWDCYDSFIVGSDQVWNARFLLGDSAFMLSFAPPHKPRYALASSFALDSLPTEHRKKYQQELSKFSAISVRENNGVEIINNELCIKKTVEVLLDPTLLLSKEEWKRTIPRSGFKKMRPYILFYMWDYAFDPKPYIFEVTKYFQHQMNCDIVALEGYCKPKCAEGLIMRNKSASTLPEFIDIFMNADLVITSSFHGTAFALNFGIPLISIVPDSKGDDRQMTLLKKIGCPNCGVKTGSSIPDIIPIYDIEIEQKKLDCIREHNLNWILNNIQCHD